MQSGLQQRSRSLVYSVVRLVFFRWLMPCCLHARQGGGGRLRRAWCIGDHRPRHPVPSYVFAAGLVGHFTSEGLVQLRPFSGGGWGGGPPTHIASEDSWRTTTLGLRAQPSMPGSPTKIGHSNTVD